MENKWILEFKSKRLVLHAPIYCLLSPKKVFLTFLALLMKLNYSTWVQNQSHGDNICFLHSSWEKKHSTSMAMALTFYYGNLELGAYPWEAGDHSEHTNDKDFVLEYLIMFSNMCFHLRFSLWITHNVDYTKRMFFVFCFFWEGQCPGQWHLYKEEGEQFYDSS